MLESVPENRRPGELSSRKLREFALAWLVFFGAVAVFSWWHSSPQWQVAAAAAIAGLGGAGGLLVPGVLKLPYQVLNLVTAPIGWVVSHLVLLGLYYLLFLPVGLIFRVLGRDPLGIRRRGRQTYWVRVPAAGGTERYFRQFL